MSKKYIRGIYNYCDRWCERCPFQHRCRVFADEAKLTAEEKDINHDKFWERLSENFKKTLDLLAKMAADLGIDLEDSDSNDAADDAQNEANEASPNFIKSEIEQFKANPWGQEISEETKLQYDKIERKTKRYGKQVDRFFDLNQDFFQEKQAELEQRIELELPIDEQSLLRLQDAFQTVRWYQYFISAKAHRSLSGLAFEHDNEAEESDFLQSDSNGSAKITLLSIQKSLAAWETVRGIFPEKTDELLDLFVLLRRIENELRALFPKAMLFVRPGFDEPRRQPRKKKIDIEINEAFRNDN